MDKKQLPASTTGHRLDSRRKRTLLSLKFGERLSSYLAAVCVDVEYHQP